MVVSITLHKNIIHAHPGVRYHMKRAECVVYVVLINIELSAVSVNLKLCCSIISLYLCNVLFSVSPHLLTKHYLKLERILA